MQFDAVVLGAGPAGMTAALYLVRSGVRVALVENAAPGGQILSTAEIENYPGFPEGIHGWELADRMDAHLKSYPVQRIRGEVASVVSVEGGLLTRLVDGGSISSHALIACTGARHRKAGIKGEENFAGKGVSYCAVCDGNFYRGQDVAVIGGGNSALEESLYLSRIVRKVWLIHRREAFRGDRIYQDKLRTLPNVEMVLGAVPEEVLGTPSGMNALSVKILATGTTRILPASGVFVYVGMEPVSSYLPPQVRRDSAGFILTDSEMRTEVRGIFAAGDLRSKRCRQVSSAVGDGATAASAALAYLEQLHA